MVLIIEMEPFHANVLFYGLVLLIINIHTDKYIYFSIE